MVEETRRPDDLLSVRRIDHVQVAIPPNGEDRARAFYVELLDFNEIPKPPELADRGELTASAREHVEMLRLIEASDHAGLDQLIRIHIGHVRGSWAGRDEDTVSTP